MWCKEDGVCQVTLSNAAQEVQEGINIFYIESYRENGFATIYFSLKRNELSLVTKVSLYVGVLLCTNIRKLYSCYSWGFGSDKIIHFVYGVYWQM